MQAVERKTGNWMLGAMLAFAAVAINANAQPYAYVANVSGNNVSVVNTATNTMAGLVSVPAGPTGLAVTPDGSAVYVASQSSNSVAVFSTSTNTVLKTLTVGTIPVALAIHPNGTQVYVVDQGSNQISVIDTATKAVTGTITVGQKPVGVAFSPDGSRAFVPNLWSGNVSVINTATRAVVSTFTALSGPAAVAVSPNGQAVYVANQYSGAVTVHDSSSGSIVATINGFLYPNSLAVTPSGSRLFVTNGNGGSVGAVDTTSNKVLATVATGALPTSVAISPDGKYAYVTNENGFSLSRLDTGTNALLTTIARVGVYPVAVAMVPPPHTSTSGCTYSLSSTSAAFSSAGGTGSVTVSTQSGCGWTAKSNVSWATITSISSGTVHYSVNADTTSTGLSGTLTIAGKTFTITVGAVPCTYSLSSNGSALGSAGGTGSVGVTAPAGCGWQALSNASWLTVTAGLSGSGSGTVSFSALANTALTSRTGQLTIGGKTFGVTEAGEGFTPIRVNCGGPAVTDSAGNHWAADNLFNHTTTTAGIANTTTPALYQTESWTTGTLHYQFSVPNGSFTVRLHFAEIYLTQRGERVFNIVINGTTLLSGFDILAFAAPNTAHDVSFPVNVTTGQITIQLVPVAGPPKLSAIEIF